MMNPMKIPLTLNIMTNCRQQQLHSLPLQHHLQAQEKESDVSEANSLVLVVKKMIHHRQHATIAVLPQAHQEEFDLGPEHNQMHPLV